MSSRLPRRGSWQAAAGISQGGRVLDPGYSFKEQGPPFTYSRTPTLVFIPPTGPFYHIISIGALSSLLTSCSANGHFWPSTSFNRTVYSYCNCNPHIAPNPIWQPRLPPFEDSRLLTAVLAHPNLSFLGSSHDFSIFFLLSDFSGITTSVLATASGGSFPLVRKSHLSRLDPGFRFPPRPKLSVPAAWTKSPQS